MNLFLLLFITVMLTLPMQENRNHISRHFGFFKANFKKLTILNSAQEQEWVISNYFIQSESCVLGEQNYSITWTQASHHKSGTWFPWLSSLSELFEVGAPGQSWLPWRCMGRDAMPNTLPRKHYLPWAGTKTRNSNTRDFFPY